jgi:hypothetical protein
MATLCEDLMARSAAAPSVAPIQPLPRYARLVLLSDFFTPLEELRARLRKFVAMGVRGHLLQVLDPAEPELPFAGRVRFEGMEHDGSALIGNVDGVRRRYQGRLEAHREGLRDLARSLGWTFASHLCDHPPEPALLALYIALSMKDQNSCSLRQSISSSEEENELRGRASKVMAVARVTNPRRGSTENGPGNAITLRRKCKSRDSRVQQGFWVLFSSYNREWTRMTTNRRGRRKTASTKFPAPEKFQFPTHDFECRELKTGVRRF